MSSPPSSSSSLIYTGDGVLCDCHSHTFNTTLFDTASYPVDETKFAAFIDALDNKRSLHTTWKGRVLIIGTSHWIPCCEYGCSILNYPRYSQEAVKRGLECTLSFERDQYGVDHVHGIILLEKTKPENQVFILQK